MGATSEVSFVCCVESGWLETQTVRMIESLRRWGGKFANAPIYAVTPRLGPPISAKTQELFERFQVHHLILNEPNKYSWNKFLNKLTALMAVEKVADTKSIAWLDSDLLIVAEPSCLELDGKVDFRACASDADPNIVITHSQEQNYHYWQEICQVIDINIQSLPWIESQPEKTEIRLYWNSGVFVYRRSTNFAKYYLETFLQLCDAQIASKNCGFFFNDQVVLGLTVVKMGLVWDTLPYSHNFAIGSKVSPDWYGEKDLQTAKIIHYHDAMWDWFWDRFIEILSPTQPEVVTWLNNLGAMRNEAPLQWRATRRVLEFMRSRQELAYSKSCKVL
jgi:hypothetical protein